MNGDTCGIALIGTGNVAHVHARAIDDALDVERFIAAIERGLERGKDMATPEYGRAHD